MYCSHTNLLKEISEMKNIRSVTDESPGLIHYCTVEQYDPLLIFGLQRERVIKPHNVHETQILH